MRHVCRVAATTLSSSTHVQKQAANGLQIHIQGGKETKNLLVLYSMFEQS